MPTPPGIDPVQLLADLIRQPSVTPELHGAFDVLEAALIPLGFTCQRVRFEGDGSYPVDNLFATRGNGGRHLLFAGHTDVVPPGDVAAWTHPPFAAEIVDGTIYGRGAADMKSGIAAFVAAISRINPNGTISLAITNDEEADSVNGTDKLMAWARAQGHSFDFAIVGEPSATARVGDSIKIGRRGSLNGQIRVTGTQGHVAYPDRANNPLPVAAALVLALSGKIDDGTDHFPPSNLEFTSIDVGNATTNVIPASALLRFNVRYNDRWTPETLADAVNDVIGTEDLRGTQVEFTVVGRPSRSFLSPLGGGVETLVETIARRTGIPPELSTGGGTSDARFIAEYCPVVECGLPGPTMHKVDENVRVSDVEELTALYATFIADYLGTK
ncbi:succinyl-diaminopimelate desuccinylase [Devosia sp. ZB163]|uniref:succinyl-diaminopimelate desuccinylase n=1 Tax=Devosia sp. ZB163 TaxID=3025938 RepID=UPI00235E358B|nr:succinyl-diaminopimelate desuccinylase [Devosia sp. ZB163]MDC9823251.1 succinyl-diaminopimelate desuccinylase [Devosia sp. ZB163]